MRYQPWWMPTAIAALLLILVALITVLAMRSEPRAPKTQIEHGQQTQYEWDLVMCWPKNFPGLGLGPENFARNVYEMSQGRLKINVHGANVIVPAHGVFDAVSTGSVEMGHSAAYYWNGKIPSAVFFTSVPFGMNVMEYNGWLYYGGGMELWREVYAPYNLIPFPGGNTGVQMGGWFNKPINSVADIRGLKMRIPGIGGEVFTRSGGTAVNIPGAELFNALQTGVIDATEWVGPYNDLAMGFYQIAKYYYYPGWHEPGPALEFIVNKDAYARLPADLQKIIEVAARAVHDDMLAEYQARSGIALQEMIEVYKVDMRPFPDEVLRSFRDSAHAIYQEKSASDPLFKRVSEHYFDYLDKARAYAEISEKAYHNLR